MVISCFFWKAAPISVWKRSVLLHSWRLESHVPFPCWVHLRRLRVVAHPPGTYNPEFWNLIFTCLLCNGWIMNPVYPASPVGCVFVCVWKAMNILTLCFCYVLRDSLGARWVVVTNTDKDSPPMELILCNKIWMKVQKWVKKWEKGRKEKKEILDVICARVIVWRDTGWPDRGYCRLSGQQKSPGGGKTQVESQMTRIMQLCKEQFKEYSKQREKLV